MSDTVNTYNMLIKQGSSFSKVITWNDEEGEPFDLTGYTAKMQIRKTIRDEDVSLELTTENGRISIVGAEGKITLSIAATDTEDLSGNYVYDLELVDGAFVERLLQGSISVDPEVTR